MQRHLTMNSVVPDGDAADLAILPTGMHHPAHGELDNVDIAGHDEVDHDAALRDSSLRTPK
ncbi:hypothetical protein [Dyella japonica]|uniref:Uncharacterized protein n=1 Tax=Dyella japonica A8 TaxID=1217721 RepID=A0A075K1C2_9GAMM|nr:hypothetical protein [Dyella japonica]AIF47532.1 hypothetical protein HY57_09730 [Dyella japonica A8]